jgi:sec-independent protein translocase protein TatC
LASRKKNPESLTDKKSADQPIAGKKKTSGVKKPSASAGPSGKDIAIKSPYPEVKKKPGKKSPVAVDPPESEEVDPKALDRGDIPMSLIGHLDEFRSRFLVSLVTVFLILLGSFIVSDDLLAIINRPYLATGMKLNVFNLIDGFLLRLKVSLLAGILLGFPVIIYELWKYIVPAIDRRDRTFAFFSILFAIILFYSGITLTYITLPLAIKALLSFTPTDMTNTINAMQYLNFVFIFCLAMGAVFELPIIIMILTKIGIVTPAFLVSKRKYAIVLIWVIAAIITPTVDPITQSLVALPLMFLYEISILISKFMIFRKKKAESQQAS